jgi:replicative DNA helicase
MPGKLISDRFSCWLLIRPQAEINYDAHTHLNIVATLETSIGRLPANIEAERSILGAVLLDNHAFNDAAEHLKPEDFSIDSHRRIYSRMMDLAESSRPIDIITLVEELEQKKDLQAVGDVGYISGLLDGVPDRPSIEHYVRIVRDKAILRGLINVSNTAIAKASEQADPADEILNEAEAAVFQLSEKRIGKGFQGIKEIVRNSFGSVDALLQRGQRITGLATHYTDLDEMTSGFQKSDLVVLAARPSMGKTALAMNIAENAAIDDGKVVGIFSLEMSSEALLQRLLCSRAIVDAHKMRTGSLWGDDMKKIVRAMEELSNALLFIDDSPGISLSEMRAKARRLKHSQGRLDLLVVDYLQLMSGGSKRFENRTQEVSSISRGLKAIAKELQVPVSRCRSLAALPRAGAATTGRSFPICANPGRLSRTPTSLCSSSAKKSISRTTPTSRAAPKSSSPSSATGRSASSISRFCIIPRASRTCSKATMNPASRPEPASGRTAGRYGDRLRTSGYELTARFELETLYPVENSVDAKDEARNPSAPTGWSRYCGSISTFIKLCF